MENEQACSLLEYLRLEEVPEDLLTTVAGQMQPPSSRGHRVTASDAESPPPDTRSQPWQFTISLYVHCPTPSWTLIC